MNNIKNQTIPMAEPEEDKVVTALPQSTAATLPSRPEELIETTQPEAEIQNEAKHLKILNISYDRLIFDPDSDVRSRVLEYGELFEELHIIVFTLKKHGFGFERISKNVWVYPTNSWSRWLYPHDAVKIAKEKLTYQDSLRADVISAQDPFEAGYAALRVARAFNRRLQIQVHSDFISPYFKDVEWLNVVRIFIANRVLPHANCVRVVSRHLKEALEGKYPHLIGRIDILPIYLDIPFFQSAQPKFDVREKYPQFNFIIIMTNRLTKEKNTAFAIKVFANLVQTWSKRIPKSA